MFRRIVIPDTTYRPTRQVLPYERLLQGLTEALQESQSESDYRRQCDKGCCWVPQRARTGYPGFKPWFYTTVNVGRYDPAEVNVKVEDGCVIIHAKHEERDGEDYDVTETHRHVKLPKGIDEKRLTCIYQADGRVLIKAPPVPPKTEIPIKGDKTDGDGRTEEGASNQDVDKRGDASTADNSTPGASKLRMPTFLNDFGINSLCDCLEDTILMKGEDSGPEMEGDITRDLVPLADSVRVVEDGDQKKLEVSLNLKGFDTKNMSVQLADNELIIGAKKEVTENGMYSLKEVHRRYPVPKTGNLDSARAQITDDGMVTVTVPLDAEPNDDTKTVPIEHVESKDEAKTAPFADAEPKDESQTDSTVDAETKDEAETVSIADAEPRDETNHAE